MRFIAKHKFKAKPQNVDGMHFSSTLEADYYAKLLMEKKVGHVVFFLRQTAFHLPGNTKYVCDFQVFYSDGTVRFIDLKGFETSEFKTKARLVEALYPITIEVIKRKDF